MTVNTDTPVGTIVEGLREIADWLEANPDLTPTSTHVYIAAKDRRDLERLAAALGDKAEESQPSYSTDVQICGRFAGYSRVYASVPLSKLTDAPPVPEYTPIIARTDDES